MLNPVTFIVLFSIGSLLAFTYHLAKDEKPTKDSRNHGDKAVHALAGLMLMFTNALIVWLVWNHVVVSEFAVPTISYVSAYFIAWAIRCCALPLREKNG